MAQASTDPRVAVARYLFSGVNFNAGTTDSTLSINLPSTTTLYRVLSMHISNASQTLTTATIGLFTGAGGTGTTLIADSAITVATATVGAANSTQVLNGSATLNASATTLYIRVGTAQGAAATGDVTVLIEYLN
jgi:hypothetical protein